MFHKAKKHLNSIKKYRLTSGTFFRLTVLAAIILAVVFAPKLWNLFDHSVRTDLSANEISNSNIVRNFFALPAYGVTRNKEQYQFENENEKIKINLSQSYSGPVEIKLSGSQSIKIFDQNGSNFKSELLRSLDTKNNREQDKYVKYESKDKRKIIYYSYQKDAKKNQKKLKNWIVYKSGTGDEKESYKIENAAISPYQNGSVAVYYSDKLTDEKEKSGNEKEARTPDLLIDRPYYFTKDGKTVDLDWKINQERNEISLEFSADKNDYPITLDPTITHNSESQFDAGTALNRTESISGPKVQSGYHELPADEHTVGLWHMDETTNDSCSGGQDVCDSSGNGNHGTATGTTIDTTNQKLGAGARSFEGDYTNNYIDVSSLNIGGTGAYSLEFWFNPGDVGVGTTAYVIDLRYADATGQAVTIGFNRNGNNEIDFVVYGQDWYYGNKSLSLGEWHHVAVVHDCISNNVRIYIDGQLDMDETAIDLTASSVSLRIGARNDTGIYPTNGLIDEVRISNIARTSEEIKVDAQRFPYAVYNSSVMDLGVGATSISKINWTENGVATGDGETLKDDTDLVAQWNFNETSGTAAAVAAGSCGTSCNGTLTNFADTSGQDIGSTNPSGWTSNNRRWGAGALMFDGSNDYVLSGSCDSTGNTGMTIEAWIKTNNSAKNIIIQTYGSAAYISRFTAGKVIFLFDGSSLNNSASDESISSINDGQWHHAVGTNDGSITKIYVDGRLEKSFSETLLNGNRSIYIGSNSEQDSFYNGTLDSISIYSRALSAEEILSNYNIGNIDIQTRTGSSTNPDDGTWEDWKPAGTETQIASMDSDIGNWSWDNTSTYIPATTANESNIKMEGTGSMKIKTGAPNVDANTVGLWHLDETNSGVGATVYDSSGNGNNGVLSGTAPAADGLTGKGRNFDAGSRIGLGNDSTLNPTGAITIETWFKASSFGSYNPLVSKMYTDGVWSSPYVVYLLRIDSNNSIVWGTTSSGGSYSQHAFSYTFSPGAWYYLAVTSNGSKKYVYVNGQQVANVDWAYSLASRTSNAYIGGSDGGDRFNGIIDEVRISNTARSAEEIAEAYRAGCDHRLTRTISSTDLSGKNKIPFYVAADRPGTYLETTVGESAYANGEPDANTVGLWHLDEKNGSGAYILDSSGNNNNGTLGSGTSAPSFTQGKIGGARSFDGSNDYIYISSDSMLPSGTSNRTVDFWIRPDSATSATRIISYGSWSVNNAFDIAFYTNNKIGVVSHTNNYYSTNGVTLDAWNYIALSLDSQVLSIYINGKLDSVHSTSINTVLNSGEWRIGHELSTREGYTPFNGIIDEVRIDNTARTPDEIRQAYEIGRRTHPITINFAASLDSGNLISGTADTSFTINSQTYGAQNKGDNIYVGEKIIVKENYDGTEYMAQGTVSGVNVLTGAITVQSWDSGSTAPSGGYTTGAVLFKWQREYWDITGPMDDQINETTRLTIRQTDGGEGRTVYLDDFESLDNYLTDPAASGNIASSFNRYFQYRSIFSTSDTNVSPYLSSASAYYADEYGDKNVYKGRGNFQMRGNMKAH